MIKASRTQIRLIQNISTHDYRLTLGGKPMVRANGYLRSLHTRGLSHYTIRAYGYDLVELYRWMQVINKPLKRLNYRDLLRYIDYQKKRGSGPRTINRRLLVCELLYQFCFPQNSITKNDTGGRGQEKKHYSRGRYDSLGLFYHYSKKNSPGPRIKQLTPLIEPLLMAEVKIFLESITRYRDQAIVLLMLMCGLRSAEVLNLKLDAVNLDERQLRVWGKGRKERVIPISDKVIESMKKYLRLERPKESGNYFFTILQGTSRGQAMTPAGIRSLFRYRRKITKIFKANPHRWRHTFGSHLAGAGVQLPVIQNLMGHSTPDMTLRYIQLSAGDTAKAYHRAQEKIDELYKNGQS